MSLSGFAPAVVNRKTFILETINKLKYGLDDFPKRCKLNSGKRLRQIVEFGSPNVAKPFHCGHLRSTIIGHSLANVKSYLGGDVIKLNYIGDWGTQFGLLSHGFDSFGNYDELSKRPIRHLFDVYVQANKLAEQDNLFREEAKGKFTSMERDANEEEMKKWSLFREYSMKEYDRQYRGLGIAFDEIHFESMYGKDAHKWINELENLKLVQTAEDGSKSIYVEELANSKRSNVENTEYDQATAMLSKSDGSSLYLSRDIAAAIDRKEKYDFDEMYYVAGKEQIIHFRQLRAILLKMGHQWARNIFHVYFGKVLGMSTRKGEIIFLEDIINEARQRFMETTMASKTTKSDEEQFERLASILSLSALYVYDLRHPKGVDYKFNWYSAMSGKGISGISLQYTHARIRSIERLAEVDLDLEVDMNFNAIEGTFWDNLIIQMSEFEETLEETSSKRDPSILVRYLAELCRYSNRCIGVARVKGETKDTAQTRLLVYHCSRRIIQKGLSLIGLEALDQI